MNVTQILLGVIVLLEGLISVFVLPYIKTHISAKQFTILNGIAQTVVYAAEKIFGAKMGEDKLAYALQLARELLASKNLTFDEKVIRAAIESQVQQLSFEQTAVGE